MFLLKKIEHKYLTCFSKYYLKQAQALINYDIPQYFLDDHNYGI